MFGQRKHKTFNYEPRSSKGIKEDKQVDESTPVDFRAKWRQESGNKVKIKGFLSIKGAILLLVLLLICMYLLEKKYM